MADKIRKVASVEGKMPLIQISGSSDEEMLRAISAVNDDPEREVSATDRISAIMAQKILLLDIPKGMELLVPISAVVARNIRQTSSEEEDKLGISTVATELIEKLMHSRHPSELTGHGLRLGDMALHYSAGHKRGKSAVGGATDQGFLRFMSQASKMGYSTALGSAKESQGAIGRVILETVPPILKRFKEVRRLISELLGTIIEEKDPVKELMGKIHLN